MTNVITFWNYTNSIKKFWRWFRDSTEQTFYKYKATTIIFFRRQKQCWYINAYRLLNWIKWGFHPTLSFLDNKKNHPSGEFQTTGYKVLHIDWMNKGHRNSEQTQIFKVLALFPDCGTHRWRFQGKLPLVCSFLRSSCCFYCSLNLLYPNQCIIWREDLILFTHFILRICHKHEITTTSSFLLCITSLSYTIYLLTI